MSLLSIHKMNAFLVLQGLKHNSFISIHNNAKGHCYQMTKWP